MRIIALKTPLPLNIIFDKKEGRDTSRRELKDAFAFYADIILLTELFVNQFENVCSKFRIIPLS